MTRSEARLEVARSILRRQLNAKWTDAECLAYMKLSRLPALIRYDDGTCEPTKDAGPVLVDALMAAPDSVTLNAL